MMNYIITLVDIKIRVEAALLQLIKNDSFLFEHDANERSVTHKLGEYLQPHFSSFHVDCEYNRHGILTKILPRECHDKKQERVYPDIVIHLRGHDLKNLLVIEVKLNGESSECDEVKLKEFSKSNDDYRYDYGLFISCNK